VSPVLTPCLPPPPPLKPLLNPRVDQAALCLVRPLRVPTDDYYWKGHLFSLVLEVVEEEGEEGWEEAWLQAWQQQLLGWLGRVGEGQQEQRRYRWIHVVWNM